ncbi:MAG: ABC transporter substrate-binding protein [Bacteroidales bacterium]|nr:ABC transporter substrate-binding protein [Clostridium sp.]MCM1202684.1 ABC transporter substrate-binding protein [Bacteroidales bacterium]
MKHCKRRNRKRIFLVLGIIGAGWLTGCGQNTGGQAEQERYVAVICKGSQHEFWKTVEQGAMDAGEELNIHVTFEAPEDESQIDVQIGMMEKAIENQSDAIVLAPLDTDRLNEVIDKAVKKGIPVLTLDSDVTTETRVATIGTDNETAGAIAARNAAELMGGEGKVAIISFVEGAQTAIARNEGFIREMEKYNGKIEIVGIAYCGGDSEVAKEQALEFIKQYPDIACIYGANEGSAVGVAAAVCEKNRQDDIIVLGFDSSDAEIAFLAEGAIDGMMVQNPYNMGYLGVRNINKVLDGKAIEERIDTGATYVNGDNLYDEDTQWLLYPLGKDEGEQ